MARLYLIRHATTSETGTRLTGRLPGVGLDPNGTRQAAAVGDLLADVGFEAIYTSPLRRCRETAKAIALHHQIDAIAYRSLIEVDYGSWSGRTLKSLQRTKAWRSLFIAPSRVTFPGGESLGAVQARAVAACEEISKTHGSKPVALVSHGDVIKAVVAHYLGTPLDLFQRLTIEPASVSIIDLPADDAPRVVAVNRTAP